MYGTPQRHLPTPEEIKQACREIQTKWDAHTREQRRAYQGGPAWLPPGAETSSVVPIPTEWYRNDEPGAE